MSTHVLLGFCWLDIVAAVILIAVAVYAFIRLKKLKNQKKDLENIVSGESAARAQMESMKDRA